MLDLNAQRFVLDQNHATRASLWQNTGWSEYYRIDLMITDFRLVSEKQLTSWVVIFVLVWVT